MLGLDDQPTIRFRPLALVRDDDEPRKSTPSAAPVPTRDVEPTSEVPNPGPIPAVIPALDASGPSTTNTRLSITCARGARVCS